MKIRLDHVVKTFETFRAVKDVSLEIESAGFAGKSRVERQRMIYKALGELMKERVHALSIRATAPGE